MLKHLGRRQKMAVYLVESSCNPARPCDIGFDKIWDHYLAANFLYPKKLQNLAPVLNNIKNGWPSLLSGDPEVFQMHVAFEDGKVNSSVSAFRDTEEIFVVQHAVSNNDPKRMIECLQSVTRIAGMTTTTSMGCMYFRPQNRWPNRLARSISKYTPTDQVNLKTRNYLLYKFQGCFPALPCNIREIPAEDQPELRQLVNAAAGNLWTNGLLGHNSPNKFYELQAKFARLGSNRLRKVIGVYRNGSLQGVLFWFFSKVPMNFSLFCNRAEILVPPDVVHRETIVNHLANAAAAFSEQARQPICSLLLDQQDAHIAAEAGFQPTDRQYSSFLWVHNGGSMSAIALETMYAAVNKLDGKYSSCQ